MPFLFRWLVDHCWRVFLKQNSVFVFEYSFRNDKCYYLFFYSFHFSCFLMSIFDVRMYNDSYFSCYYGPRPMKFTTFIDESVEKKKKFPAHAGILKCYLQIAIKRLFEQNHIYFVIIRFSWRSISSGVLRKQFCSVSHYKYVKYVQKLSQSHFISKFWSIRKKLPYQFYLARNKTAEIMKVCEVGPKNLRKNFRVEELFSAQNVSRYFPV